MASKIVREIMTRFSFDVEDMDKKIKSVNAEIKGIKEGLKLKWDAGEFNRALELTTQKAELLADKAKHIRSAMEEMRADGVKESSEQFQALRKELEYTEKGLGKVAGEFKDLEKIRFDALKKDLDTVNSKLDAVAATAAKVAAGLVAAGAGAAKLGLDAIARADEIATTAEQLGITTTALQKYRFVAMQTDVTDEALSKSIVKLNGDIGNLARGISDTGNQALLELIGNFKNADGTIKDSEQVFLEVVDALGKIEDQAVRTGLANAIFGERFAKDLNPLFNRTSAEIRKLVGDFEDIGYITEEDIKKFTEIDNKLNETREIFKQIGNEAGKELIPVFDEVAAFIRENAEGMKDFAVGVVQGFVNLAKFAYEARGAIAAVAAAFVVLKTALAITSTLRGLEAAMDGVALATNSAKTAQAAYNVVMAASKHPLSIALTAIAAVTAGLAAYNFATGDAETQAQHFNNAASALEKTLRDYTEAAKSATGATEGLATAEQLVTAEKALQLEFELLRTKNDVRAAEESIAKAQSNNTELTQKGIEETERMNTLKRYYLDMLKIQNDETASEEEKRERIRAILEKTNELTGNKLNRAYETSVAEQVDLFGEYVKTVEDGIAAISKSIEDNNNTINSAQTFIAGYGEAIATLINNGYMSAEEAAAKFGLTLEQITNIIISNNDASQNLLLAVNDVKAGLLTAEEAAAKYGVTLEELNEALGITKKKMEDIPKAPVFDFEASAKAVATLTGELDRAAKSYHDIAEAENYTASSAAALLNEYNSLIAANPALIAQHGELLAAISAENDMQKNAAEIAKAVFNIKKQLLIDELEAQAEVMSQRLSMLRGMYEVEKQEAITTYSAIAEARILAYANAADEVESRLTALRQSIESLRKTDISTYAPKKTTSAAASAAKEKTPEELALEDYRKRRADAEYEQKASVYEGRKEQVKADADFYAELLRLQTEYLTVGSDEWRKVQLELYAWNQKLRDEEVKAEAQRYAEIEAQIKDAYKTATDAAEEAYKRRAELINKELKLEKERLQAIIDNIDRELAERDRLNERQDYEKRIAELKYKIANEHDEQNRLNLEKELLKVQKDQAEWQYRTGKEQEKQAARDAIAAAEKTAEAKKERETQIRDSAVASASGRQTEQLGLLDAGRSAGASAAQVQEAVAAIASAIYNQQRTYNTDSRQYSVDINNYNPALSTGQQMLLIEKALRKLIEGLQ